MIAALILAAALNPNQVPLRELESYYWDCDTLFMKGEMSGQDVWSCLAITESFQARRFMNNKPQFHEYWLKHKNQEWLRRGYSPRQS